MEFHLGRDEPLQRTLVSRLMQAAGLQHDEQAIMTGIQWVTQQVVGGKRELSLTDIRAAVTEIRRVMSLASAPRAAVMAQTRGARFEDQM
ncbi:hypothetical protein ACFXOS_26150 [Streptomyces sp. NPDC059175]|uniref:hypothetical protein n=1 Tax=Streptomyces sp. NPDC059175 TaxID=3346757 RepID=UPI0036A31DEF